MGETERHAILFQITNARRLKSDGLHTACAKACTTKIKASTGL